METDSHWKYVVGYIATLTNTIYSCKNSIIVKYSSLHSFIKFLYHLLALELVFLTLFTQNLWLGQCKSFVSGSSTGLELITFTVPSILSNDFIPTPSPILSVLTAFESAHVARVGCTSSAVPYLTHINVMVLYTCSKCSVLSKNWMNKNFGGSLPFLHTRV